MSGFEWIVPALAANAGFAAAVFFDKWVVGQHVGAAMLATASGLFNLVVGVALVVVLGAPDAPASDLVMMLAAGALSFVHLWPYFRALRLDDASNVAPLFQLVPVFTLVIALVVLDERLNRNECVGFVLMAGGAALFIVGDGFVPWRVRIAVARLMALSSAVVAVHLVLLDHLLGTYRFWDTFPFVALGFGVAGLVSIGMRFRRGPLRALRTLPGRVWSRIACAEALTLAAQGLLAYAVSRGPVALVAVTTGFEPVYLLAIGLTLTRLYPDVLTERVGKRALAVKTAATGVLVVGLLFVGRG